MRWSQLEGSVWFGYFRSLFPFSFIPPRFLPFWPRGQIHSTHTLTLFTVQLADRQYQLSIIYTLLLQPVGLTLD